MSREIKFRAWVKTYDDDEGRMMHLPMHVLRFDYEDGVVLAFSEYNGFYAHEARKPPHEIHIMQYTGLKDKEGAELYFDCDLCELDEHDGLWYATKDDFGIPCWIPEDGGFGVHIEFSTYFLNGTRRKDAFKIHGNRFDNPELLS